MSSGADRGAEAEALEGNRLVRDFDNIPSAYEYLQTFDGDPTYFVAHKNTQRIGQRFFNALNDNDQWILRMSDVDPFHSDNKKDVDVAVRYLVNSAD